MGLRINAWELPLGIVTRKDYRLIRSRIKHQIKDYRREAAGINGRLWIIGRPLILRQGPTEAKGSREVVCQPRYPSMGWPRSCLLFVATPQNHGGFLAHLFTHWCNEDKPYMLNDQLRKGYPTSYSEKHPNQEMKMRSRFEWFFGNFFSNMIPLPRPKTSLLFTYRPKLSSKCLKSIQIALFWSWLWLHFCLL